MEYRREIDGLRAVAVIPIILFHAGFEFFSGGFVGVDVFFVISGYLITTIILAEKEQGKFSVINFYDRRARRILPALFFVMAISLPFAWFLLKPNDLKDFSQSLTAVSLLSSNILFWLESGYFATESELKPLLHTWSLAVEEQFYVFFPLYLMVVWRYRKRWILGSIIVLGFISILLAQWGGVNKPSATFFLLPTRAWELMVGATTAFFLLYGRSLNELVSGHKLLNEALGAIGLILICYAVVVFDETIPFPSFYALIPTVGTALIILFSSAETNAGKLLGRKSLVGIGLISYSAYLWHQPIFAFARHYSVNELTVWPLIILIVLTFVLAYMSWLFIEKPFRNKRVISRKSIFVFSIVGSTVFVTIGVIGHASSGFEEYFYKNRLTESQMINYKFIKSHIDHNLSKKMIDNSDCIFWNSSVDEKIYDRYSACYAKYGKGVVVLGDSHAMNLFNIVAKSSALPFVLGISQGGCRPQNNKSTCHYDSFDTFLKTNREKISYVFFHQSGSYFVEDANGKVDSPLAFESGKKFTINDGYIESTLNYLANLTDSYGVRVIWIGPFAEARIDFYSEELLGGDFTLNKNSVEIFKQLETHLINKINTSKIIDINNYVSFGDIFEITQDFLRVDDCITYMDIDHLSECAEDIIANEMKSMLQSLD